MTESLVHAEAIILCKNGSSYIADVCTDETGELYAVVWGRCVLVRPSNYAAYDFTVL